MSILVVDDDTISVKLTAFVLEGAGYGVIKAYSGQSALNMIEAHDIDLVLLDVALPDLDGFDVCTQIRRVSDIPIVFLSGRTQVQDRVHGLRIGGDDYIVKPFEPAELLVRIEAIMRRRSSSLPFPFPSVQLSLDDIVLSPVDHKAHFADGREVTLTPREFRLLYYLVQNAGRILSTEEILNRVWGSDNTENRNRVAVFIRRLRAKIERDAERPEHIVTVPNLGYKFSTQAEHALQVGLPASPAFDVTS